MDQSNLVFGDFKGEALELTLMDHMELNVIMHLFE